MTHINYFTKPLSFFLCLGMLIVSMDSLAQENVTLNGTVTNFTNGEQMPSVSVQLTSIATNKDFATTTNTYGFYSLTVPKGQYRFSMSSVGYAAIDSVIDLSSTQKLNVELRDINQMLAEVVVSSYKKRIATTEVSAHEIVAANVKRLPVVFGEPDILKTLQLLPGISNSGDATTGFNVRGGNADQNLILLDEAPLYNPSHVFGLFSVFNSEAISTFKLYKGGIPARYGGRLSSVLDVRQFEGNNKAYTLDGYIGLLSSGLTVQGPIYKKKTEERANNSFFVSARRSYFDLFLGLSSDENIKQSSLYFYDVNIKTNWKVNKNNQLFLSGYFGQDYFGFGTLFGNGWGNITGTLRWNHVYNSKIFSNISLVYSNYDYYIQFLSTEASFKWQGRIGNLFLKGSWEYKLDNNNTFHAGFVSSYVNTDPGKITTSGSISIIDDISAPTEYGLENAIYGEWEKKLGTRLTLHGGLRLNWFARLGPDEINLYNNDQTVDYISSIKKYISADPIGTAKYSGGIYYNHFSLDPRLNASYVLNATTSLKASFNTTHQYMQIISNNATTTPTDIYRLSGKYISPMTANQVTLGVVKDIPIKGKSLELTVEGFYKVLSNGVDYIDGANLLFKSDIEQGLLSSDGLAYGVEVMAEKKWGNLTGWISYTFSSSKFVPKAPASGGSGINYGKSYSTPFDLPNNLSVVLDYKFSARVRASLSFVYRSGKPSTVPTSKYEYNGFTVPFYGGRNEFRAPDYHRMDVSVTLEGKQRKHFRSDWVFSIYNLYNRQNVYSYIYSDKAVATPTGMVTVPKIEQLSIYGILPSISWQFKIK